MGLRRLLGLKKGSKRRQPRLAPGYRAVTGTHYLDFLGHIHAEKAPNWYLEIGTQKGSSLVKARCPSIAIDPEFQLTGDFLTGQTEVHLFQQTSDEFFASGFLHRAGIAVDLAFLDGMHLFEFLLRDFINTEQAVAKGGVITIHDCIPINGLMAERGWDKSKTIAWTGDVWKILPILRSYRPELKVSVADCRPTGLVVVEGLDAGSKILSQNYEAILEKYLPMTLESYGLDRFAVDFPLIRPEKVLAGLHLA